MHNRSGVIQRAIDSVLRQSFANFELIVVDDGSTDGSAELVSAIADTRVRLVRQDGQHGANAARNRGVRESKAPLIAFLDSDDAFLPHKLGLVVAAFDRQPDLGALVDSFAIVNPRNCGGRPEPLTNDVIETSEAFLAALFTSTIKARRLRKATSGITIRREIALHAGLFAEDVGRRQDMEFLARVAKVGRCATTKEILWTKYELADSISFTGNGFVAATIAMHRQHPEYSLQGRHLPGDMMIYLWESLKRRRFARVVADLRLLGREFGAMPTLSLLGRGSWAWLADPRIARRRARR